MLLQPVFGLLVWATVYFLFFVCPWFCVCLCVSTITYLLLRFDVFGLCVCERVRGVRLEYKGSALILSTAIQYLSLSPVHVASHRLRQSCNTLHYALLWFCTLKKWNGEPVDQINEDQWLLGRSSRKMQNKWLQSQFGKIPVLCIFWVPYLRTDKLKIF